MPRIQIVHVVITLFLVISIVQERIQLDNLFSRCSESDAHRLRASKSIKEAEHGLSIASNLINLWNRIPEPDSHIPAQQLVLANFIPSPNIFPQDDVVMITHTSSNRLHNLLIQIRWWNGPSDIAIYIHKPDEIIQFVDFIRESEARLVNSTFHIVMEKTHLGYPHNVLRNLVLEHTKSDYFVAMDADFITSPNAHGDLYRLIHGQEGLRGSLQQKTVFVLPAFELLAPKGTDSPTEDMLPTTKEQVRELLQDGLMVPFHAQYEGHTPTNYEKWIHGKTEEISYPVDYKMGFEPYILGYKHGIPRYWKYFRGFGYNKLSWFYEINQAGYQFYVLQGSWVAHLNHPVRTIKNILSTNANKPTYVKFEKYLKNFYG